MPGGRGAGDPRTGAAPSVHLRGANLSYGGAVLFDDLELVLPAGETTCLLGPSGVGKTSLLRLIAGLTRPSADAAGGEAVDGRGRSLDGRIAYLAQQDLLLPWASAVDNVTLGWRLRGARLDAAIEARAGRMLSRVGLAGRERERPDRLSRGMRQRVALARTLMEDRPVVLMDEPFSGLDAITRYELQALAAEVLDGRTVFLVTHDPLEALRVGHRVLVMAGRPAGLGAALKPAGFPPRDPADPALLAHQAELLKRLGQAKIQSAPAPRTAGEARRR